MRIGYIHRQTYYQRYDEIFLQQIIKDTIV